MCVCMCCVLIILLKKKFLSCTFLLFYMIAILIKHCLTFFVWIFSAPIHFFRRAMRDFHNKIPRVLLSIESIYYAHDLHRAPYSNLFFFCIKQHKNRCEFSFLVSTLSYLIDCWFFPIRIRIHSFLLFCFFLFRISFWLFSYLLSPTHSREFNRKEVLGSSFLFCSLLLIWWFNLLILIFVSSGKLNHYVVLQLADNH